MKLRTLNSNFEGEMINLRRRKSPQFVINVAGNDEMVERRGIFKRRLCNNWKLWCLVL